MNLKKTMLALTTAAMLAAALALTACGPAASEAPAPTPTPEAVVPPVPTPGDVDDMPAEGEEMPAEGEQAPAPDADLTAMVDAIYEVHPVEVMMLSTTAIDLTNPDWARYNAGLDEETAAKVDAAVLSESMTGSQAYSLVLARVKDTADAPAVAEAMLANIDPRKWVCVGADRERVVTFGDTVLFVMASNELTDVDAICDAAAEALGVSFDSDNSQSFTE